MGLLRGFLYDLLLLLCRRILNIKSEAVYFMMFSYRQDAGISVSVTNPPGLGGGICYFRP